MKHFHTILLLCLTSVVQAATLTVSTFPQFQAAVLTNAVEGDLVYIMGAGFSVTAPVEINRNISFSIAGSGTNVTILTNTGDNYIWIRSNSTNVFNYYDMRMDGNPLSANGSLLVGGNPPTTPMAGPVHVYNLTMPYVYYRGINMGYGDSFGLIDHCYFQTAQAGNFNPVSFGGNEYSSWATSNPLGTTNACYVEDCYFRTTNGWTGNGFFDAYNGAQAVLRHNTFDGTAANGDHGYDSQVTSARTLEVYANTFTNITGANVLADVRGGTFLWFSNTIYAPGVALTTINPLLKYYRGCDGIVSSVSNYANVDQVLQWASNPTDGTSFPLIFRNYRWKNTLAAANDVKIGATLALSISNLAQVFNKDSTGSGTAYFATTTTNEDVLCKSFTATTLTVTNRLDGTQFGYSWPAAFQHGVLGVTKYTNSPVILFPCYGWQNFINGTNSGFGIAFDTDPCNGHNNVTNLLHVGRDYFVDIDGTWAGPPVGYAPLIYPHPLNGNQTNTTSPAAIITTGHVKHTNHSKHIKQ